MAATSVLPAMNGDKNLFSFFNRSQASDHDLKQSTHTMEPALQLDGTNDNDAPFDRPSKESATAGQHGQKQQKTLKEIFNPKGSSSSSQNDTRPPPGTDSIEAESEEVTRRKRRRTTPSESIEVGAEHVNVQHGVQESPLQARQTAGEGTTGEKINTADLGLSPSLPSTQQLEGEPVSKESNMTTPPKKMLRLNGTGKFSSPVSKKPKTEDEPVRPKKRGRPRKSLLAKLKYDVESSTGSRITRILAGEDRCPPIAETIAKKPHTPRNLHPAKPTHPFFVSKPASDAPPKIQPRRKASAITPGKLRRQTMSERDLASDFDAPDSYTSALLKDRLIAKHPGAKDPAWPAKGLSHLRGFDSRELEEMPHAAKDLTSIFGRRKQKAACRPIPQEESVLAAFSNRLRPEQEGNLRSDGFRDPHPSLRLPTRALIPEATVATCAKMELSRHVSDKVPVDTVVSNTEVEYHPAVKTLLDQLPITLSAFDEGRGEALSWTQKYAPTAANQVLQPAREMSVLKDWLASLTVSAVGNASKVELKTNKKPLPKPKKKKRPKDDDLADFLVDDDEDVYEGDSLADVEDVELGPGRGKLQSVVQSFSSDSRVTNIVLLSGPHGCGKSAAAYAVAKELGFKVFEINPSERRSGKDVLDKVGDMTENHLVRHHGTESAEVSSAEEPSRIDEDFQRDLASGRQGKMNSFFKPKPKAKPQQSSPKKVSKAKILESVQQALRKPAKDQQQSLILLEEIDILYKDDKDFWNTVFKLVAASKRPFIMTCNDEDLVPLQAMKFHAILRFSLPPVDLATDYLLLIAAAEGHLLERNAVTNLYESKGHDLRASIDELNFWCQIGVGDPRGGLTWLNPRWPLVTDSKRPEDQIRVISENTYQPGMGIMPEARLDEDSQLCWAYAEYGIEPADFFASPDVVSSISTLKGAARLSDALSAIDVFSGSHGAASLDSTQKPMTEKARTHYIEGMALLQTDEAANFSQLSTEMNVVSLRAAYRASNMSHNRDIQARLLTMLTSRDASTTQPAQLTRHDFTCFDAISNPTEFTSSASSGLAQSIFDGPLGLIVTDVAPYVRSILHYEAALNNQREQLDTLMMGSNAKPGRKTRAARSALEGSQRESTRRERWFVKTLDVKGVLATGGDSWPRDIGAGEACGEGNGSMSDGLYPPSSSAETM